MRALRLSVLLALVLALIPAPAGAQDLDVSFEVVEETPVSVTIRVTISGATAPIQATARVDDYHGTPSPPVQGITLSQVERVARYQHKPETETVLVPIDEKIATLTAEVDSLEKAPIAKGEDTLLRKEAIDEAEWIEAEYLSMWDSMLTYGDTEDYVPEPEPAEETLPTLVQSLVLVFIVGLAQRQRDPILYLVAALTVVFIGYTLISYSLMWSWLVAVAIYLAYRAVLGMWGMARA